MGCFFIILIAVDIDKAIPLGNNLPGLLQDQFAQIGDVTGIHLFQLRKIFFLKRHIFGYIKSPLFPKSFL